MITYKDKTFCASPDCKNECGRQLTKEIEENAKRIGLPLSLGWFCGLPLEKELAKQDYLAKIEFAKINLEDKL